MQNSADAQPFQHLPFLHNVKHFKDCSLEGLMLIASFNASDLSKMRAK